VFYAVRKTPSGIKPIVKNAVLNEEDNIVKIYCDAGRQVELLLVPEH
jgi:hypothetical protein